MFLKTWPGHHLGSVRGHHGPLLIPVPATGQYIDMTPHGWQIYRLSDYTIVIADNLQPPKSSGAWTRFIYHAHGVILRQLGKTRVVLLLREISPHGQVMWCSNANIVTGVGPAEFKRMSLAKTSELQPMI